MKLVSYAENQFELAELKEFGYDEVIISEQRFSRLAKNKDVSELAKNAKDLGFKVSFEWDILVLEKDFESLIKEFEKIDLDNIDVIRVQDPGVLEYILEATNKDVQLITETGNHNLTGLRAWKDYIGDRLDRFVLSIELSQEKIKSFREELDIEIEVLCMGKILLFYSPRHLLNPLKNEETEEYVSGFADSEESPHSGFQVTQNSHGSFMFHFKHLYLLDKYDDLLGLGVDYARVDLRDLESEKQRRFLAKDQTLESYKEYKKEYPFDAIRGYFQINKSDVLFKKLKNYRIQRKDENYLGEIIEISKPDYMAVQLKGKSDLSLGDELSFLNPEGKNYSLTIKKLKDISDQDVDKVQSGSIALIQYMGGVWVKSQAYRK